MLRTVLIVEQTALVSLDLKTIAADGGFAVIVAGDTDHALVIIEGGDFQYCLLDIDIDVVRGVAVARALIERDIPFAFCWSSDAPLPSELAGVPIIQKPIEAANVLRVLQTLGAVPFDG